MPGFPVIHHLPELAQTQVHQVGDAIQPSHPLSSTFPAFNLSQENNTSLKGLLCGLKEIIHTELLAQFLAQSSVSVQFSHSVMSDALQPHGCQASLSFTISQSLLKLKSIESVVPTNHLILCHPLLLPSIFPSIRVFSNEPALRIRWPKYWASAPQTELKSSRNVRIFTTEKEMATHSSILALRIPGMGEPGGLPSMGLHRVRHNWSDLAAAAAADMGRCDKREYSPEHN